MTDMIAKGFGFAVARRRAMTASLLASTCLLWAGAATAETEIKIGYMKHPIQDANIAIMEKWAAANDVKLTKIPMAYNIFLEKVTATLTSSTDQFDIVWHNDDWGQVWYQWLEPTDDIPGMANVAKNPLDAFRTPDGKVTVEATKPLLRFRLEGAALLATDANLASAQRGYDAQLLGWLEYDPARGDFTRFDIVVVPRSTIGNINVFTKQFFGEQIPALQFMLLGWQLFHLDRTVVIR